MPFSWLKRTSSGRRILAPPVFEGDDYKTRIAALLNLLLLACMAVALVVGVLAPFVFTQPEIVLLAAGLVFVLALVALVALRRGHVRAASTLIVAGLLIFSTLLMFFSDGVNGIFAMSYVTLTVMAGLLLGGRVAITVAELCALAGLGMVYAKARGFLPAPILVPAAGPAWLNLMVNLAVAVALLYLAIRGLGAALDSSRRSAAELQLQRELLEKTVAERTRDVEHRALQLRTAAEVGRAAASILELGTLTQQVVELVRERFNLYYAGLFLLDDAGENAVLVAGSGEAGRIMRERGHKLSVGGMSMVGAACSQRQARIALDVGAEPRGRTTSARFDNPLLPETRSEMALPLMVGGRVLGALDVQSTTQAAFSEEDIAVLQLVADQVAVAVDNARKFSTEAELLEAASPLFRVGRRLASAVTMDEIVQAIVASVAETEADGCVVGRLSGGGVGQGGLESGVGAVAASPTPVQDATLLGGWNRHPAYPPAEPSGVPEYRSGVPEYRSGVPEYRSGVAEYRSGVAEYRSGVAGPLPAEMLSSFLVIEDVIQDPRAAESLRSFLADPSTPRVSSPLGGVVNVPLRVADQAIGFVTVYRTGAGPFSPVSIRLYEVLADQAAVAMERQRLLDEAQSRADRERLISQVTGRMRESLDVRRVLETAADEIYQALGLEKVVIRLEPAAPGDGGGAPEHRGQTSEYTGTPKVGSGVPTSPVYPAASPVYPPASPVYPAAWSASSEGEASGNDGKAGGSTGGTGEISR